MRLCPTFVTCCAALWMAQSAPDCILAADPLVQVSFEDNDGTLRTVPGRVLIEAQDGGILLEGRDGRLWNMTGKTIRARDKVGTEFSPYTAEELGEQLRAELGNGFEIHITPHYVICSNTGTEYARWCGDLFERLHSAFRDHWNRAPFELADPEFPLQAIIFSNQRQFAEFATQDVGADVAENAKGYYAIQTNRIVLYDLTAGAEGQPAQTMAEIVRRVAAFPASVTTVIHEATHQIAFNCGMNTRFADNPLWLTEGMATYFETPDLKSRTGWQTTGRVNSRRLVQFQAYVRDHRRDDALRTLIASDARFVDREQKAMAYAEAWALTYFLIKTRRKPYLDYLDRISKKPRLFWDSPEQRLEEFQSAFGEDLNALDREFMKYMRRIRR